MEGRVRWRHDLDQTAADIGEWAEHGASHLSVDTMRAGLRTVNEHLAVLEAIADRVGLR
ncbi:hypothetical protein H7I42_19315 [Mycolicibacterium vanbaalenii PYR-1]|nr:hypothetical protein [Mycolicibacterium vanbaalenii PYR-1]